MNTRKPPPLDYGTQSRRPRRYAEAAGEVFASMLPWLVWTTLIVLVVLLWWFG
jgi:hypothetical protein